jgi:ABC-type transporter Mla subunit MlaD
MGTSLEKELLAALPARLLASQRPPMPGSSPEVRARWLFVAILVALVLAGLGWFSLASSRYATYEIVTHEAVSGLMADAPVEFHGVDVGKVERVELTNPTSVRVLLHVRKDAPVTAATVATITSRGLASKGFTGYVYVALENDDAPALPVVVAGDSYRQIRSAPARSVNLDTAMSQVNGNVQALTSLLQNTLDAGTIASLKESLASMRTVSRTLADNSERMNVMMANAERASRRLGPLLQSGADSAAILRNQVLPQASQALADVDRASASLMASADRASARLEPLLESGNESAHALQTQLLPQAYEAVANLERLATSLNGVASRIDRDPSLLVRSPARAAPGPGEAQ